MDLGVFFPLRKLYRIKQNGNSFNFLVHTYDFYPRKSLKTKQVLTDKTDFPNICEEFNKLC